MINNRVTVRNAACFVFLASFFIVELTVGGQVNYSVPFFQLEVAALAIAGAYALLGGYSNLRQVYTLIAIVLGIAIIQLCYLISLTVDPIYGIFEGYAYSAIRLFIYISIITIFSVYLYDEEYVVKGFYYFGVAVLLIGLIAWLTHKATGTPVMIDLAYGQPRVQSLFSEPSATAPVVAGILILGWKRRSYAIVALALVYGWLTASPTVYVVTFASVIGVYLLEHGGITAAMTGLLLFTGAGVLFIVLDGLNWIILNDVGGRGMQRLAAGAQFAITASEQGYNPRFAGALDIWTELHEQDLLLIGHGLNSANVYFEPITASGELVTRDFSLILTILFSYGLIGVAFFMILIFRTIYLLVSTNSKFLYLFIPFLITSCINSAQGFITYKFVLVGIIAHVSYSWWKIYGSSYLESNYCR